MSQPTGIINLIHRAPLDITYQHQIDFTSPSQQESYWGSKIKYRISDTQYVRREIGSIKVNKSFDALEGINYLSYQARTDTGTKRYYCFVTDKEYVSDDVTLLRFTVDVFQTYQFDYKFKPSYISQAHVDRWKADHKPKYSRTDEGLNYGSEYITESAYRMVTDQHKTYPHGFYLIYMTAPSTESGVTFDPAISNTVVNANPIPYSLLLIPDYLSLNDGMSGTTVGFQDGTNITPLSGMHEMQAFMAESGAGEYIKQIVYLPYLPFTYSIKKAEGTDGLVNYTLTIGDMISAHPVSIKSGTRQFNAVFLQLLKGGTLPRRYASMGIFDGLEEKIPSEEMWAALKAKPRTTERDRRYESKLLCYPYRYNIFTDWVNTPVMIKNEYLTGDAITVRGSIGLGFNTPRRYWIENYRSDPQGREASITQAIPFEQPVISDAYYTYLLQNKNQISANLANATANAYLGTAQSVVSGFASGGVAGALAGGVGSGVSSAVSIQNMIRSENAKQSDIRAYPDTISRSNDVTLAIADGASYLTFYRKAICCEFEEQLAQYWHMYGYKVNQLAVPDLRSRVRYNYIKTVGANIEGQIESNYLAQLKAIYDNGVTIWHYSDADFNPLDYTYENPEVSLI